MRRWATPLACLVYQSGKTGAALRMGFHGSALTPGIALWRQQPRVPGPNGATAAAELLEANGFEVLLVDPSYTKQVKGRPKTDRLDCQWVYRLHSVGLLSAAFRPDEKACQLRAYLR